MFVGTSADLFATLYALDLGVPLWRMRKLDESALTSHALVLLELDPNEPSEVHLDRIAQQAPRATIVAVARELDDTKALQYLGAGAFGAIDPATHGAVLARQLRGALRGEPLFGRAVTGRWLSASRQARANVEWQLTRREREVLALIARGSTDRDIALALGITLATAQKHVAHVLKKLGVAKRAAAVARVLSVPGS